MTPPPCNCAHVETLIAETDPIDAALDPQRAIRTERTALEESK